MDPSPANSPTAPAPRVPGAALPCNILVREASTEDAELIAWLTRISWAEKVAPGSSGHHEDVGRVLHDLRLGGGFILLVDGRAAGSVRWLGHDYEPAVWHIVRMGVLPALRGAGLSQHLLEAVIHHALASGISQLRLAVHSNQSRLIDLYSTFGFELMPELDDDHADAAEAVRAIMCKMLAR